MRKIHLKIILSILFIVIVNLVIAAFLTIEFTRHDFNENLMEHLYAHAMVATELVKSSRLAPEKSIELDRIIKRLGEDTGIRITIIMPDGVVYADSLYDPEKMENHLGRVEVQEALMGREGTDTRVSPTLGIPMTYLAVPYMKDSKTKALVRVAVSQASIQKSITEAVYESVLLGTLIGGAFAIGIGLLVARNLSKPIKQIKDAAVNISQGDFQYRLKLERNDELFQVAESLNNMSERLGSYFDSINEQKEKISAILSGMREEMLLINADERIALANQAFCRLIDLQQDEIIDQKYWEAIRVQEVSEFIRNAMEAKKSQYRGFNTRKDGKILKYYRMSASPIFSEKETFRGIVVIFHDVTHIKEMENMRREFVDNASHELKTPTSSVLAVSETLIDREPPDPQTRLRFYQTIHGNTQRLNNLINDLLSLSEIEQKKGSLKLKPQYVSRLLNEIIEDFSPAIKTKNHKVHYTCPQDLPLVPLERKTISRALGNILDNAIRYTGEEGEIKITANAGQDEVTIEISDNGIGIPEQDVNRIFERFYRVDKTRSIKLGGTGLGLSIARHIIEAHGGGISVKSALGQGSTFTVHLPLQENFNNQKT